MSSDNPYTVRTEKEYHTNHDLTPMSSTQLYKVQSLRSNLAPPLQRHRTRSSSAGARSLFSADDFHELRLVNSQEDDNPPGIVVGAVGGSKIPITSSRLGRFWSRNKGLALVVMAQVFGTLMNITTRLLELGEDGGRGMNPFQILFARMSITSVLCLLYMWWKQIPDAPFGVKGVRLLLIARGVGGFLGVFGLYWSLQYLPLSDATVLTFLAPTITCYTCSKILKEPFTRAEQLGGFVSLLGVVLIARPTYLFHMALATADSASVSDESSEKTDVDTVTDGQRLAAVGMAMVGVLGAAIAYTTIRWIGQRAHPLISVNYFATWCTLVSTIALAFIPSIPFILPSTSREWFLLFFIGVSGFAMQFLLTSGLRYEKSSRATNMVYSQMLFAIAGDELIFGVTPGVWSLAGSALILGSAIVVAVQKEGGFKREGRRVESQELRDSQGRASGDGTGDEEMGLVDGEFLVGEEDEDEERGRRRTVDMEPRSSREEAVVEHTSVGSENGGSNTSIEMVELGHEMESAGSTAQQRGHATYG